MSNKDESKQTKEVANTAKKVETYAEKEARIRSAYRRGELTYNGRLHIDPKYLDRPGKHLRIDNADPATRHVMKTLGYTPVVDPDIKVGSGSLSEPNQMGSEVSVEQGITFSQPGILYECDLDEFNIRKKIEAEDNAAMLEAKIEDNQSTETQKKMRKSQ